MADMMEADQATPPTPTESKEASAPAPESWADFDLDSDDEQTTEPVGSADEPPSVPAEESPAPSPVVEAKPAVQAPPVSPPAPAAVEPPAPAVVQAPPVPVASTTPVPQVDFADLRRQYVSQLESQYAIPAEQATQLLTEPEVVLPKLAAQVHAAVVEQVMAQFQHMLPAEVVKITEGQIRESEAKSAFYLAWPELAPYEEQVIAAGKMFRQINPTATKEQAIQAIGQLAMQALGLQRAQPAAVAPQAPAPAPSFRPAGVTPARKPAPAMDPFQQALADMISDDF